jgi:2'-5' RNA ligase
MFTVYCTPELSRPDIERIQTVRAQHDPQGKLLGPHVTVVFPTLAATERRLLDHVTQIVGNVRSFRAAFRSAITYRDLEKPLTYAFLLPDEGASHFVRLHHQLLTGPLERALRLDLPFVPHITLGAFERPEAAKSAVDAFNAQPFTISGFVNTVNIARLRRKSLTLALCGCARTARQGRPADAARATAGPVQAPEAGRDRSHVMATVDTSRDVDESITYTEIRLV